MAVFSLAVNVLMLTMPLYMLQIYDRVLPSQSTDTLVFLSLIAGLALLVLGLLEVVRSIIANRVAARLDVSLSDLALRTVIRRGTNMPGLIQPVRDVFSLRGLLSSKIAFSVLDLPFSTLFIGIMYFIHPSLFWITVAGAAVLTAIAFANQWAIAKESLLQARMTLQSDNRAENLARNSESLIAMGMVGNTIDKWGADHAQSLVHADRAAKTNAWFAGISRTVRFALQIAILGYGAKLVLDGEMTPGMIFAASIISGRGLQPIDQVIGSWRQLATGWQSWKRVSKFLQDADIRQDFTRLPAPHGKLEVAGIYVPNWADPARPPILKDISFRLLAGESAAVLGPSGSGKTTLARIVVGAMKPRAGHVRLDGNDIANWDPEELGRDIGYLAQDVELIPGTIAQNISRFAPDAEDADIVAAARLAHAEDLIQAMPNGYDTPIGVGGIQISGGEKQRVALARAFFREPRLLVLDEPNSSLDRIGEMALMRALAEAKEKNITVLIITQREMVLNGVDKILRMQNGSVSDFGNRDDIIAKYRGAQSAEPEKNKTDDNTVSYGFAMPMSGKVKQK